MAIIDGGKTGKWLFNSQLALQRDRLSKSRAAAGNIFAHWWEEFGALREKVPACA
jgi:hypothetical protein